jgi:hypothetical protein
MKRSTLVLTGVLVVLILATVLVLQRPGEQSVRAGAGTPLLTLDSAAVDRLEIASPNGRIVLAREGGTWMIAEPIRYKADRVAVGTAVGMAGRMTITALASSNPQKQGVFQVDSNATLVRVFEKETEKAAVRIGKAGPAYTQTYVRLEGSDDVYLVDGSLSWTFVKPTRDWRDRSIFTTTQDSIRSVRFQYGDTTFVLSRADTLWRVDGAPVDQGRVDGFLAALSSFATDDFVDSAITAPGQPAGMVTVDGIQIAFLPHLTPGKYYVRTSLNAQVFEVQDWKAKQVLKRKSDFTGAAA